MMKEGLPKDIDDFRMAVEKLSVAINTSKMDWSDSQAQKLAVSIRRIASLSKSVILNGHDCQIALSHFYEIEQSGKE